MSKVLMPAYTVAEWGGLHENVLSSAQALRTAGHEVTLVLTAGLISEKAVANGFQVINVDWDNWKETAAHIRSTVSYDLIIAQPQKSRELAISVNKSAGKPLYVMFHGYYSDHAIEWHPEVTGFLPVTSLLADFLIQYCKVPSWKVSVVPNGVPSNRFELGMKSLASKLKNGCARVIIPSRIDKDKVYQQEALKSLLKCIRESGDTHAWEFQVLGDGPEKRNFQRLSRELIHDMTNVSINFTGWVDSEEVPRLMNEAFLTIGAGRGALQSIAVGTPVLAAGKFGVGGLQYGHNLRVGLWNNFGDYPFKDAQVSDISTEFNSLFDPVFYNEIQETARDILLVERNQSNIDLLLATSVSY